MCKKENWNEPFSDINYLDKNTFRIIEKKFTFVKKVLDFKKDKMISRDLPISTIERFAAWISSVIIRIFKGQVWLGKFAILVINYIFI